jgi:signal-transduction protein with cAMP-binding, CBS, and nucleotidyltransferase domain
MGYERELTDEELDRLLLEALDRLADSVREVQSANELYKQNRPTAELATQRRSTARQSLRDSLEVYHNLREQIEQRYHTGHCI